MTDSKHEKPDSTIVGGQPHGKRRRPFRGKIQVPVGLEKALFHAARDHEFKQRLLADPRAAIDQAGIHLRPSELAMLAAVPTPALEDMIARVVPENPRKRKFMGLVANAAASLAAGTVLASCEDPGRNQDGGAGSDDDTETSSSDGGTGTGTDDGGTQTGSTTTADTDTVETDYPDTAQPAGVRSDTGCGGGPSPSTPSAWLLLPFGLPLTRRRS